MESVKIYFDPRCPWCYLTSKWAWRLAELGEIELDWGLCCLEILNLPEGADPLELEAISGPALRCAVAIREKAGSKAIGPFYKALARRTWESRPPAPDLVVAVRESVVEAGFEAELFDAALADPQTWAAVVAEHRALIDRARSIGVPTIALDGGDGPMIFGPVLNRMPSDAEAVELWRHVSWLVRYDNFSELKRGRLGPPTLPAVFFDDGVRTPWWPWGQRPWAAPEPDPDPAKQPQPETTTTETAGTGENGAGR
ncbi:hypothetical protein ACQEVC_16890 [Plantactinospora sp. CA-294935]|uniref:mycothiol-dependent nitroreductase Rv2466c family protein n=1 Tax=Plantactinospora sp. CA-294935 TaxID=3240012 RepID=UPI003D92CB5E